MNGFSPTHSPTRSFARRGVGLIHLVGGFFVSGLVLGVCVPLFITGQRYSEMGRARSRMTEQARRIAAHLREDLRQANTVQVGGGGRSLLLTQRPLRGGAPIRIRYQATAEGLVRDAHAQRDVFSAPPPTVRFERDGLAVTARLAFVMVIHGRRLSYRTECTAVPRALQGL